MWCQQHDMLTLEPTSARNYEMPAQSAGESAEIMLFLMGEANPSFEMVSAVSSAAAWLEKTALHDVAFTGSREEGRRLVKEPGSDRRLWARYYEIGTDRPIFGDRDKSIHDDVNEISRERRNGYAWFTDGPAKALSRYAIWQGQRRGGS